jgi:dipeptide/tripeptide permease
MLRSPSSQNKTVVIVQLNPKNGISIEFGQLSCNEIVNTTFVPMCTKLKHNTTVVEDVKALFWVLILLLPMPLFACLFDQQSSKWVFQACNLDGHVPWLFNVVIQPDQMQVTHSDLLIIDSNVVQ